MPRYKTLECQRRASANYAAQKDRVNLYFKKGAKKAIERTGVPLGAYVWGLVAEDLTRRGLWPPEESQDGEEVKSEL